MKFLSLLLLSVVTVAFASDGCYTDGIRYAVDVTPTVSSGVFHGTDALTFYTNQTTFEAENPGLVLEDFSATLVPPSSVQSDAGALNYDTDNSLFALHTIVEGISVWEISGNDMVVLTPDFLGVTSVSVGPNTFADDAYIEFTEPTTAFGCFIVMPNGGATVNIEVFGSGGSLGSTSTVGGTGGGTFWGVYSDSDNIESILFEDPTDMGELFANIQFGVPTALDNTTWGAVKTLF